MQATTGPALCAGPVGTKLCAGCWSYWSRLAVRPPGSFWKNETKNAGEPHDCPCQPQVPQMLGVGLGLGLGCRSGVGLLWADVQG